MAKFYPYTIHHIQLNNDIGVRELDVNKQGNYLVFWWMDIGLGQFYLEPGKSITKSQYLEKLIEAIKPAIQYYEYTTAISAGKWEIWLLSGDKDNWQLTMNLLMSKFTDVAIPASVPVSVVICTRNRPEHLQQCLIALKNLQCVPEEIVVVDNAPDNDSSQQVVESFEGVTYVREPRPGLDFARNTGILNSTRPIIAFTDDDVRVQPAWVYRVWETFQDPSVGAMTGLIIALALETDAQFIFEKYWSFNRGYIDKVYDDDFYNRTLAYGPPVWEIGAGANMAFRKSVFETTGIFDELLDVGAAGCNGDSEMWFRILSKGFSIKYNPRAITYHEHRKDLKGLKKQIFYYMRGFATAALIQQANVPAANYKKYKLRKFPAYYRRLILQDFPKFDLRLKTVRVEILGIFSGMKYYNNNKKTLN
jgi:glycosyltransferase involved in cell wall biosynthesis